MWSSLVVTLKECRGVCFFTICAKHVNRGPVSILVSPSWEQVFQISEPQTDTQSDTQTHIETETKIDREIEIEIDR